VRRSVPASSRGVAQLCRHVWVVTCLPRPEARRARRHTSCWKMNFLIVCLGVALVIVLTKATSLLVEWGWYFTFGGFLFGVTPIQWPAILIKLGISILVGLLIGFFVQENSRGTAGAIGFSSAFILAWPAINDWQLHARPELVDRGMLLRSFIYFILHLIPIWQL
jgi:hypothetical protein